MTDSDVGKLNVSCLVYKFLYHLKIEHVKAAYGCASPENTNGCGGSYKGMSGTLNGATADPDLFCEWYIQVPDGYQVEITFTSFAVRMLIH